jgi:phosphoadenosine phosphosulfate reductase
MQPLHNDIAPVAGLAGHAPTGSPGLTGGSGPARIVPAVSPVLDGSPGRVATGGSESSVPTADARASVGFDPATDPAEDLTATLRKAIARHGGQAVLLCSFQKEESVLIDELLRVQASHAISGDGGGGVRIVTIDTGVLFEETMKTWREFEQRFGVSIEVQDASNPAREGGPWSGPEHCCSVAKVAALERALDSAEGWITGIRREQGPTRAGAELIEHDERRGLWKYNPLAHWTEKDLWRRIHERDLPYNPLHDQGYESIGCAPCTQPGSGREGRWAGTEKTECGLHVEPATQ